MNFDLPFLWALVVGFALAMYIILDGFDLGVGILLLTAKSETERDLMVQSIAPVWDGNETWLVMVGVGLLGGFPLAYGILLPAFYLPAFCMLMCLAFRGVSFEFRFQAGATRRIWDYAFAAGSVGAAVCQGLVVGGMIQGVHVANNSFTGGALDFVSPFSILTGLTLPLGYAYIGASWLAFRTENALAERSRGQALAHLAAFVVVVMAVVLWAGREQPQLGSGLDASSRARGPWWNTGLFLAAAMASAIALFQRAGAWMFVTSVGVFLVTFGGLELALYPYIVPFRLTVWQAASAETSQQFLLIAIALLMPVVLCYSAYSYYVFRGKVRTNAPDEEPAKDSLVKA
jgi:cytochrome d ubiquinol oxidase subunit II